MKKIKLSAILESGNYWAKGGHERTYISEGWDLMQLAGWTVERYKTGCPKRVTDAEGDKVSNNKAWNINSQLSRVFYDHKSKSFSKNIESILGIEIDNDLEAEESDAAEVAEEVSEPADQDRGSAEVMKSIENVDKIQKDTKAEQTESEKADKWKRIPVNVQNIQNETEKAVLIAMPHSSKYDGFNFWFPKKLVREGSNSYEVVLSVLDDMDITIRRQSEKTWAVLAKTVIGADELIEAFGQHNGVTESMRVRMREDKVKTVKHEPAPLEPVEVEADASLVR